MKILYIHQYFTTPDIPGATRSYWVSQALIEQGHEVTMIYANDKIVTNTFKEDRFGIKTIAVKVSYSNSMSIFRRFLAFVKFMFRSTKVALQEKDVDLVYATSTPLTIGFPALVVKFFKGTPFVFEVRDLWPEVPIQMGALKNPIIIRLAKWFERHIYKKAAHIIALSPGMEDGVLAEGIPQEKVSMISNMAKIDKFWVREPHTAIMEELQLKPEVFKVIYFGSLGVSNAIDYILDAAKLLVDNKSIEILFLGNGSEVETIKNRIASDQLTNVRYLGNFNMEKTSEIVNICDVSLVTFSNIPILATNSPNKLFDSLSAGKPIIVNSPGWTKTMVEEHQCGFFVDPNSEQALADRIVSMSQNRDALIQMGLNSRKLAETEYDKSILCGKIVKVVHAVKPPKP